MKNRTTREAEEFGTENPPGNDSSFAPSSKEMEDDQRQDLESRVAAHNGSLVKAEMIPVTRDERDHPDDNGNLLP